MGREKKTMTSSDDRSILRRGWILAAGAYAAVLVLAISDVAALVRGASEFPSGAVVRSVALHTGFGWLIALVCVVSGLLGGAPRARSLRFTFFLVVVAIFSWPLSRSLSTGGGIVRRGFGTIVEFGLPVFLAIVGGFSERVLSHRRVTRGWRILLFLVGAIGLLWTDRRFFVGLYATAHDALLFLAVAATGGASAEIVNAVRLRRFAVAFGILGVLASAGAVVFLARPSSREDLAVMENFGRTSARLERRLREVFPQKSPDVGSIDDSLARATIAYRAVAEKAKAEYGRIRPERNRANLLWISIDALRGDRPSAFGGRVKTPTIDALAARSAVFPRAYAQYPSTGFSVESMFRGRYPKATPIYRAMKSVADPGDLAPNLPALLKAQGFWNAASLAFSAEWLLQPSTQSHLSTFDSVNFERRGAPELAAEFFVDSAIATLRASAGRRLFLWLHLFDPHHPYTPHDGLTEGESAEARYDGEIRYVDRELGRFFEEFQKLRGAEDTIIVLNADHGEAFGEHGVLYHSTSLYDEQVRIPLIVHVPGTEPRRFEETAQNVDIFETVADALGLDRPFATQGKSLLPLIIRRTDEAIPFPDFAYAELPDDIQEVDRAVRNVHMLVYEKKKIIRHMDTGRIQLFDLAADPGETADRSLDDKSSAARMEALLNGLSRWTEDFGRTIDIGKHRRDVIAKAKIELASDDPFRVAATIGVARTENLTELEDDLVRIARSEKSVVEVRYDAFDTLLQFDARAAIDAIAREFSSSGSAILRWAAMRSVNGGEATREILDRAKLAEESHPRLAFERALLSGSSLDDALFLLGTAVPETPEIRKRTILSVVRSGGRSEPSTLDVLAVLSAGFAPREEAAIARALAPHPKAFLRWLRGRAPDRYLSVDVKDFCLDEFDRFDDDTRLAIGTHFLARWDPEFDRRAKERLAKYFSSETIEHLRRLSAMELGAREMGGEKKWSDAADRFQRIAAEHPSRAGALAAALWALDYATAANDRDRVRRSVDDLKRSMERISDAATMNSAADLLDDAREFLAYDPLRGPAVEGDLVRVVGLERPPVADRSGPERLLPGEKSAVSLSIENGGDRLYLSGRRKRGLVVRMLWKDTSGAEWYGDVQPLAQSLPARATIRERVVLEAPPKAGRYKVRPIVVEYPETRFHYAESPEFDLEFDVVSVPPAGLGSALRFSPAEIEREWFVDPTMQETGIVRRSTGTVFSGVTTFYRRGLTLKRVLSGDNAEHRLTVRGHFKSDVDGAHALRVTLEKNGTVIFEKSVEGETTVEGGMRVLDFGALPIVLPAYEGGATLHVEPGRRPGFWELSEIAID